MNYIIYRHTSPSGKVYIGQTCYGWEKPVIQIDIKTNNVIQEWVSGIEVQRQLGIDSSAISKVCKGKLNQTGGFKWKYKE